MTKSGQPESLSQKTKSLKYSSFHLFCDKRRSLTIWETDSHVVRNGFSSHDKWFLTMWKTVSQNRVSILRNRHVRGEPFFVLRKEGLVWSVRVASGGLGEVYLLDIAFKLKALGVTVTAEKVENPLLLFRGEHVLAAVVAIVIGTATQIIVHCRA